MRFPSTPGGRSLQVALRSASLFAACAMAPAARAQQGSTITGADSAQHAAAKGETSEFGRVSDRFSIYVGGYLPAVQTHGRFSTALHNGTDINFENVLGLSPNTQTFNASAAWRISTHNFISFDYFSFGRTATKTIADSIVWGEDVYHAGATLNVNNHVDYYGLSYRYYVWRERNWEFGPGLGVTALDLSSSIGAQVSASDTSGAVADTAVKKGSVLAPAPLLGLFGDWEFVPRLFVRGSLEYIYVNDIAGFGGHVTDDGLGVEWYAFSHVGIGAFYHFIGASVTKTFSNSDKLTFKYVIQGPALYLRATL